jgi:hypothetical protein
VGDVCFCARSRPQYLARCAGLRLTATIVLDHVQIGLSCGEA